MSFGMRHLSSLVAGFMASHPEVHVELVLNDRFVDPIEEGFDAVSYTHLTLPTTGLRG